MKHDEKKAFLLTNHRSEWLDSRSKVDNELCWDQPMFCVCGSLATGLHERTCRKYNRKVDSETIKRLKHLLKQK